MNNKNYEAEIEEKRKSLEKEINGRDDNRQLFCGTRFNSNETVIERIKQAKLRNLKKFCDNDVVRAALLDCASADYYYAFEKDWGYEEPETDDAE